MFASLKPSMKKLFTPSYNSCRSKFINKNNWECVLAAMFAKLSKNLWLWRLSKQQMGRWLPPASKATNN